MFSDSFKMQPIFDDTVMEVKAKQEGVPLVCNLVEQYKLKKFEKEKKEFMVMIKAYLKKMVGFLNENEKADRVKPFQASATEFIKFVVGKFDSFTFYTGESEDATGAIAFSYQMEEDYYDTPTFLFMLDGLVEEPVQSE